jgi:hypothetical protein
MTRYIYNQGGSAVGFVRGRYIQAVNRSAVGQQWLTMRGFAIV